MITLNVAAFDTHIVESGTDRAAHSLWCQLFVGLGVLLANGLAWGSTSGLNNIPTTETVPKSILVLQWWGNFAGGEHPDQFVGFKYGLFKDVEIGVDWKAGGDPHTHATLQAKYAFDVKDDLLRAVIGVANVSDNSRRTGEVFPYAAASLDLKVVNLHFGYAPQPDNEAFFGGIDKAVSFLDRNLLLRFDCIHINDRQDMLFSGGFLYDLAPQVKSDEASQTGLAEILGKITANMILESWVSKPSTGDKETYTVKLNYVIPL
ncbi:MAG: hypothetical protein JSU70_07830 [Phycisphaerales bacterium]|nr:MAG: hypothetical protein JSU70_07830 [Phycisphaerales bacterium]